MCKRRKVEEKLVFLEVKASQYTKMGRKQDAEKIQRVRREIIDNELRLNNS